MYHTQKKGVTPYLPLAPGRWAVQDNAVPIRLAKNANALSQPDSAVLCAAQGNTAGGPLARGRSLALPGSKDCNRGSATPSDVRGNRRIIVGRPRSWQSSPPGPLGGRVKSLGAKSPSHVPAHPPASLAGAGTYLPCWV